MHLHDYLGWPGPVTMRQHEAWGEWRAAQWNRPGRLEHYLMAAYGQQGGQKPGEPLVFKTEAERKAAEQAEVARRSAERRAGGNVVKVQKTREEMATWTPEDAAADMRRRAAERAAKK